MKKRVDAKSMLPELGLDLSFLARLEEFILNPEEADPETSRKVAPDGMILASLNKGSLKFYVHVFYKVGF